MLELILFGGFFFESAVGWLQLCMSASGFCSPQQQRAPFRLSRIRV